MKDKFTWKKMPSVTRENKFFYSCNQARRHVVQSWITDLWHLQENGKQSEIGFETFRDCMKWAENNVLH